MNLKKIFAIGVSVAMLSSAVVANAELIGADDGNGVIVVSTMPTKAELQARTPSISIVADKISADNSSFSTVQKRNINNNSWDVYRLTYTLSDLGDLTHAYDEEYNDTKLQVGIGGLTLRIPGLDSLIQLNKTVTPIGSLNFDNITKADGSFNVIAYAPSAVAVYPALDADEMGVYIDNATASLVIDIAVTGGASLTVAAKDITADIDYQFGYSNMLDTATVSATKSDFVLGETTPEPATLGLTADLIGHYDDRGYIWNANVTKGENEISSFGVEFSAGGDTKTGSIANISALTNKYTGAEFTFQVGLKTTKTLDSATFSIADGGDPITADAPVSK